MSFLEHANFVWYYFKNSKNHIFFNAGIQLYVKAINYLGVSDSDKAQGNRKNLLNFWIAIKLWFLKTTCQRILKSLKGFYYHNLAKILKQHRILLHFYFFYS